MNNFRTESMTNGIYQLLSVWDLRREKTQSKKFEVFKKKLLILLTDLFLLERKPSTRTIRV